MFANFTCEGGGSDKIPEDTKEEMCKVAEEKFDDCGYSKEHTNGGVITFEITYHEGDEEATKKSLKTECKKAHKEKKSESE